MRRLTINNKEYTFKFSIEASLYDKCTESAMNMLMGAVIAENGDAIATNVRMIAQVPKTALTLFYAGLLEYHGAAGDKSVMSMEDAKELAIAYMEESKTNFHDLLALMMDIMGEDNFFDLVGLTSILTEEKPRKRKNGDK